VNDKKRRFVVYGPPGAGKSTLAERMSRVTGLSHIELDAIFWKPNWTESPIEEFRANVSAALEKCPDGWICDGNYSKVRDIILTSADAIVWICPPFPVAFWHMLNRTIARAWDRKMLWGTNRESWRQSFLSRNSIILFQMTNWRQYGKFGRDLEGISNQLPVIRLRSNKDIKAFLNSLG
jgi:adenylate kinase family enzyme